MNVKRALAAVDVELQILPLAFESSPGLGKHNLLGLHWNEAKVHILDIGSRLLLGFTKGEATTPFG